ncbi:hypothetical protein [Dyella mobilis]|uniref:Argininosuccinate lyase n=1 Tax=Dyella mobilis TaxID=1849582 RepID=A0ABS2KCH4_9GAMM|nr:hypothetical protein [Dyella mobilis]MBM7128880.1 hypothetical protein [Dyella mobilis]GLQ99429.1 hypothetical protein GCM10007863_38490 [Dyella mobilis]
MKHTAADLAVRCLAAASIGIASPLVQAAAPKADTGGASHSSFVLEIINDTRSHIDSFSITPAGTDRWNEIDFMRPMQESSFDSGSAVLMQIRDGGGCLHDLRTTLSDGNRIVTRRFDLCHFHAYRPGTHIFKSEE